jgi:hypothetical protein
LAGAALSTCAPICTFLGRLVLAGRPPRIFGKDEVTMFEMTKLVSTHLN